MNTTSGDNVSSYTYNEYLQRLGRRTQVDSTCCPTGQGLRRGFFPPGTHWDAASVARAREYVQHIRNHQTDSGQKMMMMSDQLKMLDNTFATEACLTDFLKHVLASNSGVGWKRLTLSIRHQPNFLSCLASLTQQQQQEQLLVDDLVLEFHDRLTTTEAAWLPTIVQLPRRSLTLRGGGGTVCLAALARNENQHNQLPNDNDVVVKLEQVTLRSPHQLQRFVRQLVSTSCTLAVTSLQLVLPAHLHHHLVQRLPLLLSCRLTELELCNDVMMTDAERAWPWWSDHDNQPFINNDIDHCIFQAARYVLEQKNTTLQRLSVPDSASSPVWVRLWAHSVFPALSASGSNTTLQRIEFGDANHHHPYSHMVDEEILGIFLQHLPRMRHLTSVRVPWHRRSYRSWLAALERLDTLQHVDFVHCHRHNIAANHDDYYFHRNCPLAARWQDQIQQQCHRNRLVAAAKSFLTRAPHATSVLQQLAELHTTPNGFSAAFVLLRGYAGPLIHCL